MVAVFLGGVEIDASCAIKSLSQSGEEDLVISRVYENFFNGTYVEIGALDGKRYSNTFKLRSCMGWRGLLVEGQPDNYAKLKQNRVFPDVTIHSAVCAPPTSTVQFSVQGSPVSGDVSQMAKGFVEKWHPDEVESVTVPCRPMSALLLQAEIKHVHFFSLDVEGAELEVLETIDFARVRIDVFVIELDRHNPPQNWKVRRLLHNLHYNECVFPGATGRNGWFIRRSLAVNCRTLHT